jgi:hypothetical protein
MDHMAAPLTSTTETPISVPIWAWFLVATAVALTYLLTMENGGVLGHVAAEYVHEVFHDARHFAGVPCH